MLDLLGKQVDLWWVALSFFAGGVIGSLILALCMAASNRDNGIDE
jgi:phage shock protein PspC (stress-responsive transcriptional regulator)